MRVRTADDLGPLVSEVRGPIHLVPGERVLLDADLAKLYGVTTGSLNKAVRPNLRRFPADFMFNQPGKKPGPCHSNLEDQKPVAAGVTTPTPSASRGRPCRRACNGANAPSWSMSPSCVRS
jgi:hypothetical protein